MSTVMKTLTIGGTTYEIVDKTARTQISSLSEKIDNLPSGGTGLTSAEKTAMLTLFKAAAYTANVSATITQLETLWGGGGESGGGDSGGGDSGGGDSGGDAGTTFSITNNLTNVTTDNSTTEISEGALYSANLTADDGYTISSVVITMGGEDISTTAYGDGVISIGSVTGDIVITAAAEQMHTDGPAYQLPEETTFGGGNGYDTGYALFNDLTKDLTVVCELSISSTGSEDTWWSCTPQDKYYLSMIKKGGWFNSIRLNTGTTADISSGAVSHLKAVIVLEPSTTSYATVYYASNGALASAQAANGTGGFKSNPDATIVFTSSSTVSGTMHDFKVYERKLVESEIKAYLGVE